MASNSSLALTSLDFDTLKSNFITFLKGQTAFKDYNFSGSNMNVLLDVMSYNSYLNSFYLNMVASEMFLDSAQKLDSVISHAKELNYIPESTKSSTANISFSVNASGINPPFVIPRGTPFYGVNANGTYSFITNQTFNCSSSNSTYVVSNLQIFEGSYLTDTFIMDYTKESQQFILSNPNIDISSLNITVTENGVNTIFTQATTTFNLNSSSNVYFLQAAQDGKYEIVFGDNLFGRLPINSALISANYIVSKGAAGDGVSSFICGVDLGTLNNGVAILSGITTLANSSGGSSAENIETIRKFAPRYFAAQQRAVTSDDYSSLILDNFGGQTSDVSVIGGQLLTPKQYGVVAVCIKPQGGTIASNYVKSQISNYLLNYIALPNRIVVTDPSYIYVQITSTVNYDITKTSSYANEIQSIIVNAIVNYSANNLEKFNKNFYFSIFSTAIDNADVSIISNNTEIQLIKRISPLLNYSTSYTLYYGNSAEVENRNSAYGYVAGPPFYDEPQITSTPFTYVDSNGTQWPTSYIRDDNYGKLVVYTDINNVFTILTTIGTVDYTNGIVQINNLTTSSYGDYIEIFMTPNSNDILVSQDKIIIIDPVDVMVTANPTTA